MSKVMNEAVLRAAGWSATAIALVALVGCSAVSSRPPAAPASGPEVTPDEARQAARDNAAQQREAWRTKGFDAFKAQVYREPFAGGKYIVNGDTPLLNDKQLEEFFQDQIVKEPAPRDQMSPRQLILHSPGGQVAVWNATAKRQLTYCVSRTFNMRYAKVVADMAAAGGEWSKVADVQFVHVASLDNNCTASTPGVVFDVRPVNVNGEYLARAFFPNDPRAARNVLIDASAFQLPAGDALTLLGILRHELGHTLGFRHEHTRPEAGTCFEDVDWKPVTDYDALSVMHYPQCNGLGDWSLTLTVRDQQGAACVYGPAPGFEVDFNFCPDFAPTETPQACAEQTVTVASQQVSKNQERQHGPFAAVPGTRFEARMLGAGAGDPDLYVQFGQAPTRTSYACRPYAEGADESCTLDVPAGQTQGFVMVRGYTAATYHLIVTHTPTSQ